MRIRIRTAKHMRSLSHDWYYGDKEIIEIEMSPAQWAEAITSPNIGDGVPCTILYLQDEKMPDVETMSEKKVFEKEFKKDLNETVEGLREAYNAAKQLLTKKSLTKADREQLLGVFAKVLQEVECNFPFVAKSFNEAMDKVVHSAKLEVESFVLHQIMIKGLEAIQGETLVGLPDGSGLGEEEGGEPPQSER